MRLMAQEDRLTLWEGEQPAARVEFPRHKGRTVAFTQTWVAPAFAARRQELLDQLFEEAARRLIEKEMGAIFFAPEAQRWFARHPEYRKRLPSQVKEKPSY